MKPYENFGGTLFELYCTRCRAQCPPPDQKALDFMLKYLDGRSGAPSTRTPRTSARRNASAGR